MNKIRFLQNIFYKFVSVFLLLIVPSNVFAAPVGILPTVTTGAVSSITQTTASAVVNIIDTGNSDVTEIGIEYGPNNGYGSVSSGLGLYSSGYTYVSEFGQIESINGADDVVVDSAGNIYVSDYNNTRIIKFNSAGVYQSQFGSAGSGAGEFNAANAMAIDSSDNIYVNDYPNSRIQVFSSSGVYQRQVAGTFGSGDGELNSQYGFDVDSSGNLYVADWGNNRVQKFNSVGVYQSQFGSYGSGNGEFDQPADVAFDSSGNIYVVDYNNNRVQKFNSAGVYQSQFGTSGSSAGEFSSPYSINIDSLDYIYVADGNGIQVFNSSGVYQSRINSGVPGDFTISSSDIMYVSNFGGNVVQKFSKITGSYALSLSGLNCGTRYYYRAYASNTTGTVSGSGDSFVTSSCPTVVLIPSAPVQNISVNTESSTVVSVPVDCLSGHKFSPSTGQICPSPVSTDTSQKKLFLKNLEKGMIDLDVKRLQEYLNTHNYPVTSSGLGSLGKETLLFGSGTKNALMKFQKSIGLPSSGYFGPRTRDYLNNQL